METSLLGEIITIKIVRFGHEVCFYNVVFNYVKLKREPNPTKFEDIPITMLRMYSEKFL